MERVAGAEAQLLDLAGELDFHDRTLPLNRGIRSRTAGRRSSPPARSPRRASRPGSRARPAASCAPIAPSSGKRCISDVNHHEKRSAFQTRRRQRRRIAIDAGVAAVRDSARSARATGSCTSVAARFRPLAPVGGTMCAASPARNRRPKRIGSATKLRSGAMLFSIDGPVTIASAARRVEAAPQLVPERVVGPVLDLVVERAPGRSSGCASAMRIEHSAKPRSWFDVDQLVRHRRRVRQHAEPAERIDLLVHGERARRHAGAADAVEAVAAGDEVAGELVRRAVLACR